MGGPGLEQEGIFRLLGRERECAAIDRLLEDARAGTGRALVVRGEAGIGKSSLLEYATQRAAPAGEARRQGASMAVLSAVGVEAESDLAFAGLHELLRPVLTQLGELPATQAQALSPLQRARTELLYGEWLRRERRRVDARGHLRKALETFRGLGAVPWAERAEAELRATGETVRKRDIAAVEQLTSQELQIAGLVAEGLTNKEIAAQLFLSPRTVDYHLRKVFTKLGIISRGELIRDGLPARDTG